MRRGRSASRFGNAFSQGAFLVTVRPHVKVRERGSRAPTMRDNAAITSRLSATSAPSPVVSGSLMQRKRLKRSRFWSSQAARLRSVSTPSRMLAGATVKPAPTSWAASHAAFFPTLSPA